MPVKEKVNKSAEIRKVHSSGVKSAAAIVAQLKSAGIKVTPALVYQVLSKKKSKKKNKSKVPEHSEHSEEKETVVDHAVVFVKSAGGMQKARELLSKLALLKN